MSFARGIQLLLSLQNYLRHRSDFSWTLLLSLLWAVQSNDVTLRQQHSGVSVRQQQHSRPCKPKRSSLQTFTANADVSLYSSRVSMSIRKGFCFDGRLSSHLPLCLRECTNLLGVPCSSSSEKQKTKAPTRTEVFGSAYGRLGPQVRNVLVYEPLCEVFIFQETSQPRAPQHDAPVYFHESPMQDDMRQSRSRTSDSTKDPMMASISSRDHTDLRISSLTQVTARCNISPT